MMNLQRQISKYYINWNQFSSECFKISSQLQRTNDMRDEHLSTCSEKWDCFMILSPPILFFREAIICSDIWPLSQCYEVVLVSLLCYSLLLSLICLQQLSQWTHAHAVCLFFPITHRRRERNPLFFSTFNVGLHKLLSSLNDPRHPICRKKSVWGSLFLRARVTILLAIHGKANDILKVDNCPNDY